MITSFPSHHLIPYEELLPDLKEWGSTLNPSLTGNAASSLWTLFPSSIKLEDYLVWLSLPNPHYRWTLRVHGWERDRSLEKTRYLFHVTAATCQSITMGVATSEAERRSKRSPGWYWPLGPLDRGQAAGPWTGPECPSLPHLWLLYWLDLMLCMS